jgi:putative ABC transport system substrate-binding protein
VKRREFITLVGGAAAWPLSARAQQPERIRRVGVLIGVADDAQGQARLTAFQKGMQELGWTEGRNIRFDIRFSEGDSGRAQAYASELVAMTPDAILGTPPLWSPRSSSRPRQFRSCSCRSSSWRRE